MAPFERPKNAGGAHRADRGERALLAAFVLDGQLRAEEHRRAFGLPADPVPSRAGLRELREGRDLHPIRYVPPQLGDPDYRGRRRRRDLEPSDRLWLLPHQVAWTRLRLRDSTGEHLSSLSSPDRCPLRHLCEAALD